MPEPITKSWLREEWRFIISVVAPILAVSGAWFALRSGMDLLVYRVDEIENNHLVHVQSSLDKIVDQLDMIKEQHAVLAAKLNIILNK